MTRATAHEGSPVGREVEQEGAPRAAELAHDTPFFHLRPLLSKPAELAHALTLDAPSSSGRPSAEAMAGRGGSGVAQSRRSDRAGATGRRWVLEAWRRWVQPVLLGARRIRVLDSTARSSTARRSTQRRSGEERRRAVMASSSMRVALREKLTLVTT
jgi:hypothetical protein